MKTFKAEQLKDNTIHHLNIAYTSLRQAQNFLSRVQGEGFSDIYFKIGDIYYDEINPLIERLEEMKPTGLAEI